MCKDMMQEVADEADTACWIEEEGRAPHSRVIATHNIKEEGGWIRKWGEEEARVWLLLL
jgi:hypothetical protein